MRWKDDCDWHLCYSNGCVLFTKLTKLIDTSVNLHQMKEVSLNQPGPDMNQQHWLCGDSDWCVTSSVTDALWTVTHWQWHWQMTTACGGPTWTYYIYIYWPARKSNTLIKTCRFFTNIWINICKVDRYSKSRILILFHLCKWIVKTLYFGEKFTKYTPRDEVTRTNFRAASRNGNAVVVIITRFTQI